ncbi:KAP family P-loop NTPase fold protein [Clavibacter michiganensis]|uniref:KAP family P-loop NTPase fold protein n=2 Tax=Clavibacter michiganensis TaxID=28447 RepID=UPI000B69BB95|nr:P-loop NTPase fold protein [Clavibacter michiganensis]MDO4019100.1 P-loop NTPase fold protein [Clavibacter michiganensis]MDO4038941.1 P-loop NTPase fold protein [Clavibacter michiganensis]MDO4050329.1 P-loop NTPase fold protein [Clavibacter michiganensis]MDO4085236.1 P-loop NTPase fold protein [Clavibacter michiganensis]MDO4109649.1 P-loop NTPase fold protein [Clavibacter michiganensis]
MSKASHPLFLDEPTDVDLLSFDAVASTVVDAVLDPRLDPIALGLSGAWGSGKTSVLRLIGRQLRTPEGAKPTCLVIETDPWRYDPQLGIKESLIGEILTSIEQALPDDGVGEKSKAILTRLLRRVDWTKAMKLAATSAITVSLPSLSSVLDLVKPRNDVEGEEQPEPITDMVQFRAEFKNLLESEGLSSIENVVVLVDDLDRCLPDTVVETLETIRLFLSVPKMSFVIAADEARVADAIATRYPSSDSNNGEESPARLYLHKIVQTSVPVPALSDFDTEAYLVLLQVQSLVATNDEYEGIVGEVADARRNAVSLETVGSLQRADFAEQRNNAARIRPIIHEKTRGNPRRIKRFLNDLSVRLSIAAKRGIALDEATIAKLMVLEQYFPDAFKTLTDWLRERTLRTNLEALEAFAGTPEATDQPDPSEVTDDAPAIKAPPAPKADATSRSTTAVGTPEKKPPFSDGLIRWARLSPALAKKDIAPYLVFAASFKNLFVESDALPESIRDMATQLLSRSPGEARRVTDEMLIKLQVSDARSLVSYMGGVTVDEPQRQASGIIAMLRVSRVQPQAVDSVVNALRRIKPSELKVASLTTLKVTDAPAILSQFDAMAVASGRSELTNALSAVKEDV